MKTIISFFVKLFFAIFKRKQYAKVIHSGGQVKTTYVKPPEIMPEIPNYFPVTTGSPIFIPSSHSKQTYRDQQRAAKKRRRAR